MRRSWFMTSASWVMRSATAAVVSIAPRAASAAPTHRPEEGDRDRQPGHLDQRAGDQAEAQAS